MTTENKYELLTVQASVDLDADSVLFKAVSFNGAITADINLAAGVLRSKGKTGQGVSAVYQGITKGDFAGAVSTVGFPIKLTTSGCFLAAASGDKVCGRALTTVASGDRAKIAVDFTAIANWGG
jgi:hypothetical protein